MNNTSGIKDKVAVVAYEDTCTIYYPSLHDAGKAYGLSTTQIKRLIDNEQNVPHTRTYLDYALPGLDMPTPVILIERHVSGTVRCKKAETEK
jgi:hypothetical protein